MAEEFPIGTIGIYTPPIGRPSFVRVIGYRRKWLETTGVNDKRHRSITRLHFSAMEDAPVPEEKG